MDKRCSKCGITKNITAFSKDKYTPDGYKGSCKECANAYNNAHKADKSAQDKKNRSVVRNMSLSDLGKLVQYNPETGLMYKNGEVFPVHITKLGYIQIQLLGYEVKIHRLAWFLSHGTWPKFIDHIDGNPANNRLANL